MSSLKNVHILAKYVEEKMEAQELDDKSFNMQIKPYRTSTSGAVFALGEHEMPLIV